MFTIFSKIDNFFSITKFVSGQNFFNLAFYISSSVGQNISRTYQFGRILRLNKYFES